MKEKIEAILEKYTTHGYGDYLDDVIEAEFKTDTPTGKAGKYIGYPKLTNELTTLIQEERKEAVEGFADWLDNVLMTQMRKPYIYGEQLKSAVETYLESEGK